MYLSENSKENIWSGVWLHQNQWQISPSILTTISTLFSAWTSKRKVAGFVFLSFPFLFEYKVLCLENCH